MSDDQFISKQATMHLANDLQIPIDGYHQHNQAINNYCAEIGSLPEAIVRCKDCIEYIHDDCCLYEGLACADDDTFCSYGRKRIDV